MTLRRFVPAALLATVLLSSSVIVSSCDLAATENTAILNAGSTFPPIVRYEFTYGPSNVTQEGTVTVVSDGEDDLGGVLSRNGFQRSDVVSARVDSVAIERLSGPSFEYLAGADVHLGSNTDAPRIASGTFSTSAEVALLNITTRSVTGIVRQGSTGALALLSVEDPDQVPQSDRVRVTVYYQLEVEGV